MPSRCGRAFSGVGSGGDLHGKGTVDLTGWTRSLLSAQPGTVGGATASPMDGPVPGT